MNSDWTLADVILSARVSVGDGPTDNLSRNENLNNADIGNVIDGANAVFSVKNYPVVPDGFATVQVDGGVILPTGSPPGYVPNEPIGEIQFNAAPNSTAYVTYYYYLMPDATWTEFVTTATEILNLSTGPQNISTDIENIPSGLLPAVKLFACSGWCMRIASQTGLWYSQKLQERVEDRDNISRKFTALAQEWDKQAKAKRDDFYNGAGTQLKPAMLIKLHSPRPITPFR